ncbi:2-oxoglutarate dehydrogenase complex dihydrolipoyllysine-residue succinyltransferase [Stenotrophobium rhamnosiphilum]|uniref:Dihydrolipoyllysine-residue succinyltransferase component of 2-oxoglutarate dehydrogenase complex n=1 Tax=Stenotrophobium rhamnosiphilum TaxID=2029166 RepID=A0A2T5MHB7_9GAMM|nr:2-oxoglutarate dehydrogenase complex dihydrolipoyllysine-residue succinyltransferase [Stenotrophobium rhamnosiphilum]PTU31963.1 dihydrolipoamide succinyltransferase [Stenotrophobium rhamnosiphilum]
MSIEIKVPNLPESVSSAIVATWHLKAGDAVKREQNMLDLETDKVMLEVPSTVDGILKEIRVQAGATVQAGDVLGILEEGVAAAAAPAPAQAAAAAAPATSAAGAMSSDDGQSPAVRKLLSELGLSASQIAGTGKGGRLTIEDVKAHAAKPAPAAAAKPAAAVAAPAAPRALGAREEQRVPMTRIRQRIAERLIEAQSTAAMLTTFNEVDLKAINDIRAKYKDGFEKAHGVKLGFMSFFVRAVIEALKKYPAVNASVDGTDIVYHGYYDIGIAVSSPRGLVVPILRDADQLSFADIEKSIAAYGAKAKDNKLTMEDLTGGTFSVTNGGIFGSMMSTPILNPPQSAILGMHGITERPVVVNGEIVIRPMMYLAMTYDHRIIDGREAVLSLRTIKECLEDPAKLLLQL